MTDQPSSPLAGEVARIIRLSDASSFAGSMGKLLLGLCVCVAAGFLLATAIVAILWNLFGTTLIGWTGWFLLYVLVLVPAIIWYERKFRENYILDAAVSADPSPSSRGEFRLNNFNILTGAVSSLMVWGPRGLVDGIRGMFGRRTVFQNAVLDRAVLLVLDLNVSSNRVEIKKLIIPPEDMKIFAQAVDMLLALDLAGRSTDGTSLWLISTFRQKLQDFTRAHPPAA
jgi:hypothetical protein